MHDIRDIDFDMSVSITYIECFEQLLRFVILILVPRKTGIAIKDQTHGMIPFCKGRFCPICQSCLKLCSLGGLCSSLCIIF